LQPIALVSDAGMPAISDPGAVLVAAAVAAGIQVVPVPGPCAAIAALASAGLPTNSFYFAGFLPPKTGKRKAALQQVQHMCCVAVGL
jgi:16S rRNA (cytidine1402-2'-O)-methyltransferase